MACEAMRQRLFRLRRPPAQDSGVDAAMRALLVAEFGEDALAAYLSGDAELMEVTSLKAHVEVAHELGHPLPQALNAAPKNYADPILRAVNLEQMK
jgi:hypothetical protein